MYFVYLFLKMLIDNEEDIFSQSLFVFDINQLKKPAEKPVLKDEEEAAFVK